MSERALTRRAFELFTLTALPLVYGAGIIGGVIRYLIPLPSRRQARLDVGSADEIQAGPPKRVAFNGRQIYVLHDGQGFHALDATCTHLGCRVNWVPLERRFLCPCHTGLFAASGQRLSGPPEEPLRAQAFEVTPEGRVVLVDRPGET